MTENIEKDPESLLNRSEPMTDEEERYSKIKMGVTKLPKDAHPGLFATKRKKTGYVSPRRKYYSTYYQKNKKKIIARRIERYKKSEAVREYHHEQTEAWRKANPQRKGERSNRTVMLSESGEHLFTARYACAAFGYSEEHFRTLCLRGVIPQASYRDSRGWRLYTADQIALLKKAGTHYEGVDPWKVQAILFTYWQDPKEALKMDHDEILKTAKAKFQRIKKPKEINKINPNKNFKRK